MDEIRSAPRFTWPLLCIFAGIVWTSHYPFVSIPTPSPEVTDGFHTSSTPRKCLFTRWVDLIHTFPKPYDYY